MHEELRESRNGNSLPQDSISILNCSSSTNNNSLKIEDFEKEGISVASTGDISEEFVDFVKKLGIEISEEPIKMRFNEFSERVIEYISGYIVFQVKNI